MNQKESTNKRILHIVPGLAVCVAIAILSKIIGRFVPSFGAATISIFLGILIGNTIGKHQILHRGTKFAEGTLLSISVVLLGATLSITAILEIGFRGVLFIVLMMASTVLGTLCIGKMLGFPMDFRILMASGNAVCGSSAIASTAPVIHAHSKDKGIAITMVNVTGTVLMILLPILSGWLYHSSLMETSAFLGGTLQSVGQVVAAGSMISDEVKELAMIFKIVRIIFLVFIILWLASVKNRSPKEGVHAVEDEIHSHTHQSRIRIPWYIIGFFLLCAGNSLSLIPDSWIAPVSEACRLFRQ